MILARPRASAAPLPLLGLVAAALLSCHEEPGLTGRFASAAISDRQKRVELVGRYIAPVTPVEDAGFVIDYHDNSGGMVPGPSDWSILVALRVPPQQAGVWADRYRRDLGAPVGAPGADLGWGLELAKERGWPAPRGEPLVFQGPHGLRAVYPEDGLVLIRDVTR